MGVTMRQAYLDVNIHSHVCEYYADSGRLGLGMCMGLVEITARRLRCSNPEPLFLGALCAVALEVDVAPIKPA